MTYSEKEALKQLPEDSSWPNISDVGEYDHMEVIDYIEGLLIHVPTIPDYWITARLNTAFKGHASIWQRKKVYAIEQVPEEESPKEDSSLDSMGNAIREHSDDYQDPKEEFLAECQEETQQEIQDLKLEAVMPQNTANNNLCKYTKDAQTLLVIPTRRMAYIHVTATNMTVFIDNSQHPFIIYSGAHCSIVAREYLDSHFPDWEKQLLPTKARKSKSTSGKMISIGTIIKEIIIPHRKGNIRLNKEFLAFEDSQIQGFLLGKDYQRMYGIDISNSKNRHITIEGQFSTILTSKQSLSLLKILKKNRPAFSIVEEPLGKIRGHDIKLYLDVERPYPPMLRGPLYPEIQETRKEVVKNINEHLEMDVIRKIGHDEIVEITTPVLITWHDCKYRLCGDFRAINNYTKLDSYPIQMIPNALGGMQHAYEKVKYELTNAPVLILPGFELPFKLYIDVACSQGLGSALHHQQIVDGEPRDGVICYLLGQLKDLEARYGDTQTECLCLVWDLEEPPLLI
ncbi:hypothetical protein O181_046870 [Austropuccinia psidii MF-1]|uniref:Reverse transcriptase/retrotransposon-derived protein RNase H-like domain-containing protein n=1 Tax=Austropuccinia psidii MF-1 TaxID=1389203 RepID=A0A9Q3DU94_9BASI|nr:hypothetical protein [Austropuccinia psidii MF-1]